MRRLVFLAGMDGHVRPVPDFFTSTLGMSVNMMPERIFPEEHVVDEK